MISNPTEKSIHLLEEVLETSLLDRRNLNAPMWHSLYSSKPADEDLLDVEHGRKCMNLERFSLSKTMLCRAGVFGLLLGATAVLCQGFGGKDHATGGMGGAVARQSWSTEDGLPQNSVHAILQAHDGFLWAATEGGLARFDGQNFKVFRQASEPAFTSDDVCCLTEDTRNALWIGTADGLLRESGGSFKRFGVDSGLPSSTILDVAADADGTVLALTSKGVARVDSDGRILVLHTPGGDSVLAMNRAADGSFWLVTANDLLLYKSGELHRKESLSGLSTTGVVGLAVVPGEQAVWLRSAREITLVRNGEQRRWRVGQELPGTRTESMSADSRGVLWVGTNRGLFSIDTTNKATNGVAQELASVGLNSVLSTVEDRDGDRWVGTETAGLLVLRPQVFRTEPAVADQAITAVVQTTDGVIWLATKEDGLRRVRSGKIDEPAVSTRLASRVILALAPGTHGDLWVGTADGLNHVDGDKVETYTSANGLPDDFIRSLLVDSDGTLWVGTRRGLAQLEGRSEAVLATYAHREGLRSDSIGALLRSDRKRPPEGEPGQNDLWIATFDGLSRLLDKRITTFAKTDGLGGNVVTALAMDGSGALWIGTQGGGLSRYSGGVFTAFRQARMPSDIDSILFDGEGRIWMGTRHGVAQVSVAALDACGADVQCDLAVSRYGYPDGLPSEDLSASGHPAAWRMSDGELWFATTKGVAIADPSQIQKNPAAPLVAIERFLVNDVEIPLTEGSRSISPSPTRVTIEYAGLSFRAPSRINYRYMLEGFDRHWITAGSRRTAYYTNLQPGSYRFLVEAAGRDGVWAGAAAEVRFSVEPPYYRRWWFYLLVLVAACGLVLLMYRLRLRRLRREFNAVLTERTRIAREIHDTLAQNFVGVSLQLEVVAQTLARGDLSTARGQVDATRVMVREGLDDARQSIWELRAVSAKDSLPTRLGRIVQRAGERGLKAECRVGGTYRALPHELEEEILRIAGEAVANVVRHANASTVSVDLQYSPHHLLLRVVDDGRGFDVAAVSTIEGHFGLKGMRERASTIDGQLKIESLTGEGTSVTMEVNL
jgi:ligand-binding sensor domain-containing protein